MAQESNDRPEYQAIIGTAVDGIIVIDEAGIVQSFNPAAERIFGYSPADVIGQNVKMLTPPAVASQHDSYLDNYRRTGQAKIIGIGREVAGRRKDGSSVPLELSIAEWRAPGGKRFFTGIIRDITERKRAQAQLEQLNRNLEERVHAEVAEREAAQMRAAQAERMQALGQLAGGIAHDFNNVLQAISSAADMLRRRPAISESVLRLAQTIAMAAERGASVTERLLAFARRSDLKAEPLDIARILNELARLLAQTLGGTISLRIDVEATLPPVMADKGQLETVLINLATNARDAMPSGGAITFSATKLAVGGPDGTLDDLFPGRYLRIAVSDTGSGMDEATLARATEPFFTTKPQGEGTGLGLSMAKGFAEQSGGTLEIQSTPGMGTTVSLCLPAAEPALEPRLEQGMDTGRPRILLVDDDRLVRDALEYQLEDAGYRVLAATGASEALAIFGAEGADLLVTDLSMPGMDGLTLISTLQAQAPDVPAILITGYATEHVRVSERGSFRLLRKPITPARLYEEIATCLSGRSLA